MQYLTREIGQVNITNGLRIRLKEHGGSIPRHEYILEAKENGDWTGKDMSYIKNFDVEDKLQILKRWADRLISSEEVQRLLNLN
jgi:hypothetical protein